TAVTLNWSNPADITYGTALGSEELNATATDSSGATVPGSFAYTPPAGTVLNAGNNQTLSVKFTPTNTNFAVASKTVSINVLPATAVTLNWSNPADITYGTAL